MSTQRTYSRGTIVKTFKALAAICVVGVLLSTPGGQAAALWALNAALFYVDAAVMDWADSALASPSLTFDNRLVPDMPEGIVLVEVGWSPGSGSTTAQTPTQCNHREGRAWRRHV